MLVVGVLAGAGCADEGATGAAPTPTTAVAPSLADALADRSFVGDDLTDDGDPVTLAPGTTVHLTFDDHTHLTATGGCATLTARWLLEGATLVVDDVTSTGARCDQDLMDQDDLLRSVLLERPRLTLDGAALALHRGALTMRLADVGGEAPDRPLVGTRWEITNVVEGEGSDATSVTWAAGPAGAFVLADDGTYELSTGCEVRTGTYERRAGSLFLSVGDAVEQPCDDADPTLTGAIDALVLQGADVELEGSRLELRSGEVALGLQAADAST